MFFGKILPICVLFAVAHFSACNGDRLELERSIMDQILSGYNKDLRPPADNATLVAVNLMLRDMHSICAETHQWKVTLTFRQEWNDARLKYSVESYPNYKFLTLTSTKDLWTPDLFFPTEIEAVMHNVPQSHTYIRLYPNGDALYSMRITLTLHCSGTAIAGVVTCPITAASYGYTTDELVLKWKDENPIQIGQRVSNEKFTYRDVNTATKESGTSSGKYGYVEALFHFRRNHCTA